MGFGSWRAVCLGCRPTLSSCPRLSPLPGRDIRRLHRELRTWFTQLVTVPIRRAWPVPIRDRWCSSGPRRPRLRRPRRAGLRGSGGGGPLETMLFQHAAQWITETDRLGACPHTAAGRSWRCGRCGSARSCAHADTTTRKSPPSGRRRNGGPGNDHAHEDDRVGTACSKRNGWYWIDVRDESGRRYRKKAAPDKHTALLLYRDLRTRMARGEVLGLREDTTVRLFVDSRHWPAVASTLAPEWAVRSRAILDGQILPTFGDVKLSGLRQEAIEQWLAGRRAAVSATTNNKELSRLKHLLTRAVLWGQLRVSPAARIQKGKEAPGRVRYLAPEERTRLLEGGTVTVTSNDGRTWTLPRTPSPTLRCYLVAALQTGGRRSELLRFAGKTWISASTVTFVRTKNHERRSVPITAVFRTLLLSLPRPIRSDARVLPLVEPKVLSRMFRRYVDALGDREPHLSRPPASRGVDLDHGLGPATHDHGDSRPPRPRQ